MPNSNALNPGNANVTISSYLNTTSLPKTGDYDLVRKGDCPAQDYKVELLPSGQIKCTIQGSASRHSASGGSGLNNGKWHHVVCIKTASQIETVVNGTVVATTKAAVGSISDTTPLTSELTRAATGPSANSTRCRSPSADPASPGHPRQHRGEPGAADRPDAGRSAGDQAGHQHGAS